jgi:hypothetical protein
MVLAFNIFLLVALPYGTAILGGAIAERLGGKTVSAAWASIGGLNASVCGIRMYRGANFTASANFQ